MQQIHPILALHLLPCNGRAQRINKTVLDTASPQPEHGAALQMRSVLTIRDVRKALPRSLRDSRAMLAWFALSCGLMMPARAMAYRTAHDLPELEGTALVRWRDGRIPYEWSLATPAPTTVNDLPSKAATALASWQGVACGDVRFESLGTTLMLARAGDGRNTIQWVASGWSARGWPSDAAALTDVQYATSADGQWEIVEADLYLNAEDHAWTTSGQAAPGSRDFAAVLTHEAGHMLGLLHPCEVDGVAAPACNDAPLAHDATMYPVYDVGQVTLAPDDEAGLCYLYPRHCSHGDCCKTAPCEEPRDACAGGACRDAGTLCDAGDCTTGCRTSSECAPGLVCRGECVRPRGELGDPCTSNDDCGTHRCTSDGHCAKACAADKCASGESCEGDICVGKQGALGSLCSTAVDCLGGECLQGATEHPVCSRACGSNHGTCPTGWQCEGVASRQVCTPKPGPRSGGSCALGPRLPEHRDAATAWIIVCCFVLFAKRSCRKGALGS